MNRSILTLIFMMCSIVEVQVKAAEAEAVIIEVRKNLPLTKQEKVYKNYFINGGTQLGLNKGTVVDVLRRLPVHDPLKNSAIGDLRVKVGELEIIHADAKISVGRILSLNSPEDRPILDYEALMIGDRLDLSTIKAAAKSPTAQLQAIDPQLQQIALLDKKTSAQELVAEGKRHLASLESASTVQKTRGVVTPVVAKTQKIKSPGRTVKTNKSVVVAQKKQASSRSPASANRVVQKK